MKGSTAFFICLVISLAMILGGTAAFASGLFEWPVYVAIIIGSVFVIIIPVPVFRNTKVELKDDRIEIRGLFFNRDIPYSGISQIQFRDSFNCGFRAIGYRGFKTASGTFSNKEFGQYRLSAKLDMPAFVLLRCGDDIVVFNFTDAATTRNAYDLIKGRCGSASETITPNPSARRTHIIIAVIVSIALIVIAIVVAIVITSGHVNVTLDDTGISIDAPMAGQHIDYDDIASVEYRTSFDCGSRVAGFHTFDISSGDYKNSEFGKYKLAIHNSTGVFIIIEKTNGDHVVFNCGSVDETHKMYEDIMDRLDTFTVGTSVPFITGSVSYQ